jgi:hypothetical protein
MRTIVWREEEDDRHTAPTTCARAKYDAVATQRYVKKLTAVAVNPCLHHG